LLDDAQQCELLLVDVALDAFSNEGAQLTRGDGVKLD
jgi:hypothetical protein